MKNSNELIFDSASNIGMKRPKIKPNFQFDVLPSTKKKCCDIYSTGAKISSVDSKLSVSFVRVSLLKRCSIKF